MKNVLIILASPRKHGNSELLARQAGEGIKKTGGSVEYVRLNGLNISPCQSCGGCNTTGNCIIKDDMAELYTRVDIADAVLLVSPVYFYGVTGQCKIFIDRFQARWAKRYLLKNIYRENENRKGYFLSTAATHGENMFQCCKYTVRYFFDAAGFTFDYNDSFLVHGVDEKGAVKNRYDLLNEAEKFGKRIIRRINEHT